MRHRGRNMITNSSQFSEISFALFQNFPFDTTIMNMHLKSSSWGKIQLKQKKGIGHDANLVWNFMNMSYKYNNVWL